MYLIKLVTKDKIMKLFLDDERNAPEGWILISSVEDLINIFETESDIEEISLDHDLGDNVKTGYSFLQYLEEKVFTGEILEIPDIYIHSANPVGRKNMSMVLDRINKFLDN